MYLLRLELVNLQFESAIFGEPVEFEKKMLSMSEIYVWRYLLWLISYDLRVIMLTKIGPPEKGYHRYLISIIYTVCVFNSGNGKRLWSQIIFANKIW